jgi:hypothetical protein
MISKEFYEEAKNEIMELWHNGWIDELEVTKVIQALYRARYMTLIKQSRLMMHPPVIFKRRIT